MIDDDLHILLRVIQLVSRQRIVAAGYLFQQLVGQLLGNGYCQ